jgi:hypothetical protein
VEVPVIGSWPVITRGQWRSVYRRFRLAIECSGRVTRYFGHSAGIPAQAVLLARSRLLGDDAWVARPGPMLDQRSELQP